MGDVGKQDLNDLNFELDPVKALERGAVIDEQHRRLVPPHPRGVWRGSHEIFNAIHDARAKAFAEHIAALRKTESPFKVVTLCDRQEA
jgi:hypothetical protein